MSTRSAVAEVYGDSWRGRYIHSDGYPAGVGASLWALVKREGAKKVRQTAIDDSPYGWSYLIADEDELTGYHATEDRFEAVKSYGCRYTENQGGPATYVRPDDASWCEWAYVISDTHLTVLKNAWGSWTPMGSFAFDGEEPDWNQLNNQQTGRVEDLDSFIVRERNFMKEMGL